MLTCKVMLVRPDYLGILETLPKSQLWKYRELYAVTRDVMLAVGATGTCEASTFQQAIRSAMIRLERQDRKIREHRNRTE